MPRYLLFLLFRVDILNSAATIRRLANFTAATMVFRFFFAKQETKHALVKVRHFSGNNTVNFVADGNRRVLYRRGAVLGSVN